MHISKYVKCSIQPKVVLQVFNIRELFGRTCWPIPLGLPFQDTYCICWVIKWSSILSEVIMFLDRIHSCWWNFKMLLSESFLILNNNRYAFKNGQRLDAAFISLSELRWETSTLAWSNDSQCCYHCI